MRKACQLASLLIVAAAVSAAAQRSTHAQAPAPHVRSGPPADRPAAETRGAAAAEHVKSFRGVAAQLGTTPEALQTAYEQAKAANPKLTLGQFIAANMLGHNLGDKGITTDEILAGLASGKSIGQTLHSLGLSQQEAKAAEQAAERDVKEADRAADKAAKAQSQPKPDSGH